MKKLIGIAFAGTMLVACAGSNRNTKTEDTTAQQGTYQAPPPASEQQPNSTSDQNMGNMPGSSTAPTTPEATNPELQNPPPSNPSINP